MEHTTTADRGHLQRPLIGLLAKVSFPLCWAAGRLESSLQIKKAGGIQPQRRTVRKTDAIDAQRIADRVAGAV